MVCFERKKALSTWMVVFVITLHSGLPCTATYPPKSQAKREKPSKNATQTTTTPTDSDVTDWTALLEPLYVESKLVESDELKSLLTGEIADAYWSVNKARSKELFRLAFESALSIPPTASKTSSISRILMLAAQCDRGFQRELQKQLLEEKTPAGQPASEALRVARNMLETDAVLAADVAKIAATGAPSMSGLWLVFKLSEKDPVSAQQVYEIYLKNAARRQDLSFSSFLWLAGYAFGYGEAYGGSEDVELFTGFGGLRVKDLTPRPQLAASYLNYASSVISAILSQAAAAPEPRKSLLHSLAFFGTSYLFPEVARYLPGSEGQWSSLHRQAMGGLSEIRRAVVEKRLQSIRGLRADASSSTPDDTGENVAEKLAEAEKIADDCRRDQAYTRIALSRSYAKDFKTALEIAGRVNTSQMHESLLQFIYFDMTEDAVKNGNLTSAAQFANKVTSKNQKALLYVRIASKALESSSEVTAVDLLASAHSLIDDGDDSEQRAALFLSAARAYSKFDMLQAVNVTRDAIKALNRRNKYVDGKSFSITRRLNLSCTDSNHEWYGGSEEVRDASLPEILAVIAASDFKIEAALSLAKELENRPTRIRAELSIVKKGISLRSMESKQQ
jgi:hypothetical protein